MISLPNSRFPNWIKLWLSFWLLMVLFGGLVANDLPLWARNTQNKLTSPFLRRILIENGLSAGDSELFTTQWSTAQGVQMPPIPFGPASIDPTSLLSAPNARHWLGTDGLGRDVAAMLLHGARPAFFIGLGAVCIASLFGLPIGLLAGFLGNTGLRLSVWQFVLWGIYFFFVAWCLFFLLPFVRLQQWPSWSVLLVLLFTGALVVGISSFVAAPLKKSFPIPVDAIFQQVLDVWQALPKLLILLVLSALINKLSLVTMMFLVALLEWSLLARLARAESHSLTGSTFLKAGVALGLPNGRLVLRHVLPNILASISAVAAFAAADAILAESTFSFLGMGLPPEAASWGGILQLARAAPSAWHLWVFPTLFLFLSVAAFQQIGLLLQAQFQNNDNPRLLP